MWQWLLLLVELIGLLERKVPSVIPQAVMDKLNELSDNSDKHRDAAVAKATADAAVASTSAAGQASIAAAQAAADAANATVVADAASKASLEQAAQAASNQSRADLEALLNATYGGQAS